jgi:hypothetical protein
MSIMLTVILIYFCGKWRWGFLGNWREYLDIAFYSFCGAETQSETTEQHCILPSRRLHFVSSLLARRVGAWN